MSQTNTPHDEYEDPPEEEVLATIAQALDPTQTEQEIRRFVMSGKSDGRFISRKLFSSLAFREKVAALSDLYERESILACFEAMEPAWENSPDLIAIDAVSVFANMNPSIIGKGVLSRFSKGEPQAWRHNLYVLCSLNVGGGALLPIFDLSEGNLPRNALKLNCAAMISTLRGAEDSLQKAHDLCLAACGDDESLGYIFLEKMYFSKELGTSFIDREVQNAMAWENDGTKIWEAENGFFDFIDDWVENSYPDTSWIERYLVLVRLEQGIADQLGLTLLPHPLIALL